MAKEWAGESVTALAAGFLTLMGDVKRGEMRDGGVEVEQQQLAAGE